ncbi:MAG: aminotransferase class V-fold PLP-dependent enzyme, partial [Chlamydiia bacterium]|nr:aminotransferase class V-fold PLP-dependent enzyme [Chlamydiia bacterium]
SAFVQMLTETEAAVRAVFGVDESIHVLFVASATEAMERILQNLVERSCYHIVNGAFSERFWQIGIELGKQAQRCQLARGEGFLDASMLAAPDQEPELIAVTQNETSTGVLTPNEALASLRKRFPGALIAVDVVSCAPIVVPDFDVVDCCFFSVQKAFGLPPGLGVILLNERCVDKANALQMAGVPIGTFHSFPSLLQAAERHQTPETPNSLALSLLGAVCKDLLEAGIDELRRETKARAERLYQFLEQTDLPPLVTVREYRSPTVIVGRGSSVVQNAERRGVLVAKGYGSHKADEFRIANFSAHTEAELQELMRCLQL